MKTLDLQAILKRITMQPETVKTVGVLLLLIVGACGVVWGIPILVEHAWNNFFHALFGWTQMYYYNALAFLFWLLLALAVFFGLKEVK